MRTFANKKWMPDVRCGGNWEGGWELSRYADRRRDTKSILQLQKTYDLNRSKNVPQYQKWRTS